MAEITVTQNQNRIFKDVSLTFGLHPVTNDVVAVTAEEAIKRSIKNILLTNVGEAPFFPEFGSRIGQLLFEPIDAITNTLLTSEIRASIEGFEPRVTIISLTVTPSVDELTYQVDLILRLVNQIQPVTLTLFLSRLR